MTVIYILHLNNYSKLTILNVIDYAITSHEILPVFVKACIDTTELRAFTD